MPDPAALNPSAARLAKLGSIIGDPEVAEWLDAMGKMALLPVKRDG